MGFLEVVPDDDWNGVRRNFDQLDELIRQFQVALSGRRFAAAAVLGNSTIVRSFGVTSVVRTPAGGAAGDYTITFGPVFTTIPFFAFGAADSAVLYSAKLHAGGPHSGTSLRVAVFDTAAGTLVDGTWNIICLGL